MNSFLATELFWNLAEMRGKIWPEVPEVTLLYTSVSPLAANT